LEFRQIANNTARKTVAARYATLSTERSGTAPAWFRAGNFVTGSIRHGSAQTLSYSLPKGKYLELDFDSDPKTGNELVWQGMWRIVKLT
jgi:hypothetical protein